MFANKYYSKLTAKIKKSENIYVRRSFVNYKMNAENIIPEAIETPNIIQTINLLPFNCDE